MLKKILKMFFVVIGIVVSVLLTALGTLLYFSIGWMFDTWSNLSMDELMFHLTAPLEGTNEGMIQEYLNVCVVPAVLMLFFIVTLYIAWRKRKSFYFVMCTGIMLPLVVSGIAVRNAWETLEVDAYVEDQHTSSDFIEANYVSAADVELVFPEKKRNLIYIFLESMEITYADKANGGAFEENYIPELTKLAQENEDFSGEDEKLNGGYSMPYTTWTMGGMFAQTSGLPLEIEIQGNNMDTQEHFFTGAITLGDILHEAGYSQTLLIGSDAVFGGRELYFTQHGDYEMFDYSYAVENELIPADYKVWWGYEDQKLFSFAKDKLLELAGEGEPFNLTMLTVDTHFEDGYQCEQCPDSFGKNQYANVMACSSAQISEFLDWVQQQDFYADTTIVLMGDHPTMDSDFCEDIESSYIRKVYTAYINSAVENSVDMKRDYTTFDSFPTTLAALGVKIEGDRLGLGTNLFSATQTLTERFGLETEEREVRKKSEFMEELADIEMDSKILLEREGKIPTAEVWLDEYQYETGFLPVTVEGISGISENIESVMIAVWTDEGQNDLQWIQMELWEDEKYHANISVPNFNYKTGEYFIHVYVVDSLGSRYKVGDAIGVVL